jgi:hypothetical protein
MRKSVLACERGLFRLVRVEATAVEGLKWAGMAAWKAKGAAVQTEGLENVNPLSR